MFYLRKISILLISLALYKAYGETILTAWVETSGTGYNGYTADVTGLAYDSSWVYVSTNSIPSYDIGSWPSGAPTPTPQNATFKIPRYPTYSSTKTSVVLGAIGLWVNGLIIYDARDTYSYNSLGVWNRNAYYWEGDTFDGCYGHANTKGAYHNHVIPTCYDDGTDSSAHSPLLGFIFDGYPIYGPYGYSSANSSSSSIKRILPSYKLRSITTRTSLSNGTSLDSTYYGPDVSTSYPLGSFIEDYEYSSGYGDLDEYNGRWCVTPEYPDGIYAYFVGTNSNGDIAYPFTVASYFYGKFYGGMNTTVSSSATTLW